MEEGERGKSGDERNPMLVRWKNNHMKTLWQGRRKKQVTANKTYKEDITADTAQILNNRIRNTYKLIKLKT